MNCTNVLTANDLVAIRGGDWDWGEFLNGAALGVGVVGAVILADTNPVGLVLTGIAAIKFLIS